MEVKEFYSLMVANSFLTLLMILVAVVLPIVLFYALSVMRLAKRRKAFVNYFKSMELFEIVTYDRNGLPVLVKNTQTNQLEDANELVRTNYLAYVVGLMKKKKSEMEQK